MSRKRVQTTPLRLNREIFQVALPPRKRYRQWKSSAEDLSVDDPLNRVTAIQTDKASDSIEKVAEISTDILNRQSDEHLSDDSVDDEIEITRDKESQHVSRPGATDRTSEKVETDRTENQLEKTPAYDDDDYQVAAFEINLNPPEWKSMYIINSDKLEGDWTNILSEKLSKHLPQCTFIFKKNRCKRANSRKRKAPFFRGKALCNRTGCSIVVLLTIEKEPGTEDVAINCTASGTPSHTTEPAKRQVRGLKRAQTAKKCKRQGVMTFYYDRISEMSTAEIGDGNITHCQTPAVLRKAVSEWVNKELLHRDLFQEVLLLKEAYVDSESDAKGGCSGYIQHVAVDPFTVILFGRDQLDLICDHLKGDYFLDATGSIMRAIPGQKRPLLYSLVLYSPEAPPVSVADMLSTDHTIPNIGHFLMVVKRAVSQRRRCWQPRKLETDWSWAEIQSGCIAFNSQNLKRYLNTCWGICCPTEGNSEKVEQFTVLHICSSHMTKAFLSSLQQHIRQNREFRHFMMNGFVGLCNSTNLDDAKAMFRRICIVLKSDDLTQDVMNATEFVRKQRKIHPGERDDASDGDETEYTHIVAKGEVAELDGKTISECSPWFDCFTEIKDRVQLDRGVRSVNKNNPFFCPEVTDILCKKYMAIYPLWSGIMLGPLDRHGCEYQSPVSETRATNAPVESWFKTVKADILNRNVKLRPALIISKMKKSVNGRVKENRHKAILRPKAQPKNDSPIDLSSENWRKKKCTKKKNKYHPPKHSGQSCSVNHLPSVPKWGGTYQGKKLTNTCTVDNFLAILRIHDLESNCLRQACKGQKSHLYTKLLKCLDFMKASKFNAAKFTWAVKDSTSVSSTVDLYGSEFEGFADEFTKEVRSTLETTCSNMSCAEPRRLRDLRGIALYVSESERENTIQGMVDNWLHPDPIPCGFEQSGRPPTKTKLSLDVEVKRTTACSGVRQQERKIQSLPPVLVFSVSDHISLGRASTNFHEYSMEIRVEVEAYRLAGVTLYKPGHFVSVINSSQHGWLFYDDLIGVLTPLSQHNLTQYTPSQVVYVVGN